MSEISIKKEQLTEKEELIACLQDELVKVRLREAENNALIRDLRGRIQELEEDKKTLRESTVDNSVAHLQEELIAVKLREAEANLALKDLRHRVNELNSQWQRHLTVCYLRYGIPFGSRLYLFGEHLISGTKNGSPTSTRFNTEKDIVLGKSR